MRSSKRVVDYSMGESICLDDLRQVVAETTKLSGQSKVELKAVNGQRDATYYNLIITEEAPAE